MSKHRLGHRCLIAGLILFVLVSLAPPPHAMAAPVTWVVKSTGDAALGVAANCPGDACRLRDALAAASSGDIITFAVPGNTITLTGGPLLIGGFDLTISGPGAAALTIDGNNAGRIFTIYSATVNISGLTLQHGLVNITNTPTQTGGGAILLFSSSHLTLDGMMIDSNTVDCSTCTNDGLNGRGGAIIAIGHSSLTITDSTVSNNTSSYQGGGIDFNSGTTAGDDLTLTNVAVTGNHAISSTLGYGGGVDIGYSSMVTLERVKVSTNTAGFAGGGLSDYSGTLSIEDSTFELNTAQGTGSMSGGGGLRVALDVTLTLLDSTFTGNSSAGNGGGGLLNWQGTATVANSTFTGNSATNASAVGGGIYSEGGTLALFHVTAAGNAAASGHGEQLFVSSAPVTVKNTILANSPSGSDCGSSGATWLSNANNLFEASDAIYPCPVPAMGADPQLGPLADHGGPTKTMALQAGSPAIDFGSNAACAAAPVSNRDQRGYRRPVDGNGDATITCDVGAYEYGAIYEPFSDVPVAGKEWMEPWIVAFYNAGITTGCNPSPLQFCPEANVTRAEMAVFLLRAKHGAGYTPPPASHYFADMPVLGKEWMEPWVDQYFREGLTTGCAHDPLKFCPEQNVTRAEMAVFVLRATHPLGYQPAALNGVFTDVPVPTKEWMEPWIIDFKNHGITTGCGAMIYCPENNVTRAEMAVFIGRAYSLYP